MTDMAIDTLNDEIIVTNSYFDAHSALYGNNFYYSVNAYPRVSTEDESPLRIIAGPTTGLDSHPSSVAVDWTHDELLVLAGESILVFNRTADGDVAPLRTISGESTELSSATQLRLDQLNNEIFVANLGDNSILVFGRSDNGNVEPLRKISGAATQLTELNDIVIDVENNELFVVNAGAIFVYDLDADGDVAPLRTMQINATGREIDTPCSIALYIPTGQ